MVGYLPQRLDILDDSLSVVDNVRAAAPAASVNEVRASLARFLFRGERADRRAGTLSGGERFRAVLAALLLAQPAPQLLLLDEPTNNLDMASVRQLSQALEGYRGAILVASHDVPFLRSAGITRWLRLDSRRRPDRDRPAVTRFGLLSCWPARAESARLRGRTRPPGPMPLGYGVIGSPTGSGPVSLGSSPGTPAAQLTARTWFTSALVHFGSPADKGLPDRRLA